MDRNENKRLSPGNNFRSICTNRPPPDHSDSEQSRLRAILWCKSWIFNEFSWWFVIASAPDSEASRCKSTAMCVHGTVEHDQEKLTIIIPRLCVEFIHAKNAAKLHSLSGFLHDLGPNCNLLLLPLINLYWRNGYLTDRYYILVMCSEILKLAMF